MICIYPIQNKNLTAQIESTIVYIDIFLDKRTYFIVTSRDIHITNIGKLICNLNVFN